MSINYGIGPAIIHYPAAMLSLVLAFFVFLILAVFIVIPGLALRLFTIHDLLND